MDDREPAAFFSTTYHQARARFRESAESIGARLWQYSIEKAEDFTIDVAVVGDQNVGDQNVGDQNVGDQNVDACVVVSSGVHGVEGPFGSAVQLAWLDRVRSRGLPGGCRVVLIHTVNPDGFAHDRRWNEDGVDLNRNFLEVDEDFHGAPAGYVKLNSLLNPQSAPSRWEPFRLKAAWSIFRFGLAAIKEAVASGQYEYPQGLFFGGNGPTASALILREHYASWTGDATNILHLDLHTGLGRFAEYRMLLESGVPAEDAAWFARVFGQELVELGKSDGTAYAARGTLGSWVTRHMSDRAVRFATVDFGTHGLVRVLAALRAENRAHHYGDGETGSFKNELRECFCPASERWRNTVIREGFAVISKGINAIRSRAGDGLA